MDHRPILAWFGGGISAGSVCSAVSSWEGVEFTACQEVSDEGGHGTPGELTVIISEDFHPKRAKQILVNTLASAAALPACKASAIWMVILEKCEI